MPLQSTSNCIKFADLNSPFNKTCNASQALSSSLIALLLICLI